MYHKQTDEANLGDTTVGETATESDDGQAKNSPLANNIETIEM